MIPLATLIDRIMPRAFLGIVRLLDRWPKIDAAGHIGFESPMKRTGSKARRFATAECLIDQSQDGIGRAEGKLQLHRGKRLIGIAKALGKFRLHTVEFPRIGTLKGIDGLLLVTNDKDCARYIGARTSPAGEFLRQTFNDLPLNRAGILRFIHQNMVDAAIQPVQHPRRHCRIGQQITCLDDQIVEIQPPA